MDPIKECRRKAENMMRFFAMEAPGQIAYLGNLPHDHGHPHFDQNEHVLRFHWLIDNFLASDPALVTPMGTESGIERDMQYLLNLEIGEPNAAALWSEHGLRRHAMWRILRVLAREALARAGVQNLPPTENADELAFR